MNETPIVWITGASGGVARAFAQQTQAAGWRCLLQTRTTPAPEPDTATCRHLGVDPLSDGGAQAAIDACRQHWGRAPDHLCHTVGGLALGAITRLSLTQWQHCLQVNATSWLLALQAFARARSAENGGGSALCFSSVAAQTGTPNHGAVAAAKAAVEALVRSAAADLATQRIRVNALALGLTETPLTQGFFRDARSRQTLEAQYPLGRVAQASEVAAAALWLLSDACAWMTGQIVTLDGGFSAIRPMVVPR